MLRRIMLVLVLLTAVRSAGAYPIEGSVDSLQTAIHQCQCIVRAVIVGVEKVPAPDPNPRYDRDAKWIRVKLEIRETVTGAPTSSLAFYFSYDDPNYPDWATIKTDQLFFLESGSHAASHWGNAKGLGSLEWVVIYPDPVSLAAPDRPVRTDDLRPLTNGAEILAEARQATKLSWISGENQSVSLCLPDPIAKRLGLDDRLHLEVGLNDRTFELAREWIASPDPQMQWCGAEVLVNQQSPENAAALQRFAWSMQEVEGAYGLMSRGRILLLLRKWGVKDLPPLVQSVPVFDVRQSSAWASLAGWLLLPAIYVAYSLRRRFSLLCLVWWTLISGIVVLGARSYWPRDAMTCGNFDLVFERGNIYLEHQKRASSGFPSPLLMCEPNELLRYQGYWFMSMKWKLNDEWDRAGFMGEEYADSYAEKFWPPHRGWTSYPPYPKSMPWSQRLKGPIWQIPMWLILSALVVPRVPGWVRRWVRMVRSQQRGFPVEVTTGTDRKA